MEYSYIRELDEFFAAQFSDYVRIAAIEGYKMPEMLTVDADGNITRKQSEQMRIIHQSDWQTVLANFKAGLADTEFTFNFAYPSFSDRFRDRFRKQTFSKLLPATLKKYDETPESAGKKLDVEELVWKGIVKGKYYPEKNTVMALALAVRMQTFDVNNLLAVCGMELRSDSVRDIVFEYLLNQKIYNEDMRDRCLAEYHIDTIPLKREETDGSAASAHTLP